MPTNLPASFPKYRLYQKNSKQRGFGYTYFSEPCPPPPTSEFFRFLKLLLAKKLLRLRILQNIVTLLQVSTQFFEQSSLTLPSFLGLSSLTFPDFSQK